MIIESKLLVVLCCALLQVLPFQAAEICEFYKSCADYTGTERCTCGGNLKCLSNGGASLTSSDGITVYRESYVCKLEPGYRLSYMDMKAQYEAEVGPVVAPTAMQLTQPTTTKRSAKPKNVGSKQKQEDKKKSDKKKSKKKGKNSKGNKNRSGRKNKGNKNGNGKKNNGSKNGNGKKNDGKKGK